MKTIALFNHKAGVGKTTLAFHLAWMLHQLGERVLAVDLDPQAHLTAAFLEDNDGEALWDKHPAATVYGAVQPLLARLGDLREPALRTIADGLTLIAGDLALATFEERLAETWPRCLDDNPSSAADAFRVTTAFHRIVARGARVQAATVAILDIGPSLGALSRAALVAADYVVVPLAADQFSLRGLRDLGPTLAAWRAGWQERRDRPGAPAGPEMPEGTMTPLGYVVLQHAARKASESGRAYSRWIDRLPEAFHASILQDAVPADDDPYRLALLRHFRSLLPMALEARKPIFDLTAADGAIGSHAMTVRDARAAFETLAKKIGAATGVGQWSSTSSA
ncbi:MAG: AAA family ATPase [Myxococcales bacterium]|nr:AAA family ATPase [Myxococcales bacterium]